MLNRLVNRIRRWRLGAISGAGFTENNIKMTGALVAPFLIMWTFIKVVLPDEVYDLAVSVAMMAWLVWVVMLWAWAKSDAGNYICFPQSKWKFPDGSCKTLDLKVPPDSWEKIMQFKDGTVGYKVFFQDKYIYDDPDLPYPVVFQGAYWLVPSLWDEAFQRRAYGEFFHKGVYVTKPDCEDISVYVIGFETIEGEMFPVCIINDCAFTYEKVLERAMNMPIGQQGKLLGLQVLYRDVRKKSHKLIQYTAYLEDRLEVAEKDASKDFKDSADSRMKSVRKRHARIMDTKPPLLTRIFNLKSVGIALLVITAILLAGRFIFHWW